MSSPEPPTFIIPSKRCWQWWGRRPHRQHTHGNPPRTRWCPGIKPRT